MKNFLPFITLILIAIIFSGCPNNGISYKYKKAYFPQSPLNIAEVNSEYDDYNSTLPETHFGKRLLFSSNRLYYHEKYHIYDGNFFVVWNWETGVLTFYKKYNWGYNDFVGNMVQLIDETGNQFGPYSVSTDTTITDTLDKEKQYHMCYLMYSTNANSDNYRLEFMYYLTHDDGVTGEITGPDTISFLGDERQQYISFFGEGITQINEWFVPVNEFTEMYFDKTTNGVSDIYKIGIPDSLNFLEFLKSNNNYPQVKIQSLNSEYDDRCPFVNGNLMVFASNRQGGFGGYDLYYSEYENGDWSEPVNFGEKINSEYDEFRPIVTSANGFENDVMIFSSNRPGGIGGFDLYYVGVDKIPGSPIPIE